MLAFALRHIPSIGRRQRQAASALGVPTAPMKGPEKTSKQTVRNFEGGEFAPGLRGQAARHGAVGNDPNLPQGNGH
jgi:hypothetical protein